MGETKSVIAPLENALAELTAQDPQFKPASLTRLAKGLAIPAPPLRRAVLPGWYDESDEFVQAALAGVREAGFSPTITQYSFCTNGSHYAGEAGIKTIGFGPSRENWRIPSTSISRLIS